MTESVGTELRQRLAEMASVEQMLEQCSGTKDRDLLLRATHQLSGLAPRLRVLAAHPQARSKGNAQMLVKFGYDLQYLVGRAMVLNGAKEGGLNKAKSLNTKSDVDLSPVKSPLSENENPPPRPALLRGPLNMRIDSGPLRGWKRKYLRQVSDTVFFFSSETSTSPNASFSLPHLNEIKPLALGAFDLIFPSEIIHLQADTESEMQGWLDSLKSSMKYYNFYSAHPHLKPPTFESSKKNKKKKSAQYRQSITIGPSSALDTKDKDTIFYTVEETDLKLMLMHKLQLRQDQVTGRERAQAQAQAHMDKLAYLPFEEFEFPSNKPAEGGEEIGKTKEKMLAFLQQENARLKQLKATAELEPTTTEEGESVSLTRSPDQTRVPAGAGVGAVARMSEDEQISRLRNKLETALQDQANLAEDLLSHRRHLETEREKSHQLSNKLCEIQVQGQDKDSQMVSLSETLSEAISSQGLFAGLSPGRERDLREELVKHREAERAHVGQVAFLTTEIQRLNFEYERKINLKVKQEKFLTDCCDTLLQEYQLIRLLVLTSQSVEGNLLDELEDLKKR
eukprot:TRINITY_DN1373_c0_g1_i2.p1 TRINITY_DN1373_c0_g1~~TRINITY_DN1373_c0_g1_i2.p1  ORF type:complete len:576 (+),score=139.27 TRINITY_DN1373_c0_g1_i2:34-1728(+)